MSHQEGGDMFEDRTKKLADNILIRAIARASMVLSMPTLGLIVFLGQSWINERFNRIEKDSEVQLQFQAGRLERVERTATLAIENSGKVNDRLTVVETKQVASDATASKFQNDTLNKLDQVQMGMTSMSNAISALTATMQAQQDYNRQQRPVQR